MRVMHTSEHIRVCDECESTWSVGAHITVPGFDDLSTFLEARNIASSLEYLDTRG